MADLMPASCCFPILQNSIFMISTKKTNIFCNLIDQTTEMKNWVDNAQSKTSNKMDLNNTKS